MDPPLAAASEPLAATSTHNPRQKPPGVPIPGIFGPRTGCRRERLHEADGRPAGAPVNARVANEVGLTYKGKIEIQIGESRNDLNRILTEYERGPVKEGVQ